MPSASPNRSEASSAAADAEDAAGLDELPITAAVTAHRRAFDATYGGFGGAPKFPQATMLRLLLRQWRRTADESLQPLVMTTLDRMAEGGIFDHLGGGFARYSVDARWLVPHFEKMLYDNAQLAVAYLEAYQFTGEQRYARVVRETLDYVLRDMTDPGGAFYSAEDADSEGVEGKFYTWDRAEIQDLLGDPQAETFCKAYDVSAEGNFEGTNILNLAHSLAQTARILERPLNELEAELGESRAILLAAREQRVRPGRDDKVLVSWNGLMIDALAKAGGTLGNAGYVAAARKAADFILAELRQPDGRLWHTWRDGKAKLNAYLDDYACLINALVSVYEATWDTAYITASTQLSDDVLRRFGDSEQGGFYFTPSDHEDLLARNKDFTDASVPSGNGMMALALLRLAALTARSDYLDAAEQTLVAGLPTMHNHPSAAGQLLLALDLHLGPAYELVIAAAGSEHTREVEAAVRRPFLPAAVLAATGGGDRSDEAPIAPLLQGKSPGQVPRLYICSQFRCAAPTEGIPEILAAVDSLAWSRA